jgi:hypothetical protein
VENEKILAIPKARIDLVKRSASQRKLNNATALMPTSNPLLDLIII